jgi:hypothetical protein
MTEIKSMKQKQKIRLLGGFDNLNASKTTIPME